MTVDAGVLRGWSKDRAELYGKPHLGARYTHGKAYEALSPRCCVCGRRAGSVHHVARCSRFLPMSLLDRARLRAYVRRHGVAAHAPRARLDLTCPYLTDGRECSVYEARPEVCRAYRCDLHARGELDGFTGADRAVPVDMRELAESIEEKTEGDRG